MRPLKSHEKLILSVVGVGVVGVGIGAAYALSGKPSSPSSGLAPVVVTVTDATSGALIVGASVEFGTAVATSNVFGEAVFPDVKQGSYVFVVNASGYLSATQSVDVTPESLLFEVQMQPISDVCATLMPASIQGTPTQSISLAWMASVAWDNTITEVGIIPSNPVNCGGANCADTSTSGGVTDWSTDIWTVNVTGKVVDGASAAVCGIPVNMEIGQATVPWQTADGIIGTANFSSFEYEGPPAPAITDANGNFTFPLYVSLTVTQGNANPAINIKGYGGGPVSVVETVTFMVQGTTIEFVETISSRLLICSQNSPDGC